MGGTKAGNNSDPDEFRYHVPDNLGEEQHGFIGDTENGGDRLIHSRRKRLAKGIGTEIDTKGGNHGPSGRMRNRARGVSHRKSSFLRRTAFPATYGLRGCYQNAKDREWFWDNPCLEGSIYPKCHDVTCELVFVSLPRETHACFVFGTWEPDERHRGESVCGGI